jgi:D-glycero-alpha-D-manno-heptose-7-phosphate kinase
MHLISRTPLRVSMFGGGTDYPGYFEREQGAVLGFAINKYIYISALQLSAFVDYKFRLSYSRIETTESADAIQHPMVRALLTHHGHTQPTDFSMQADLPASAGLGSSSAFTVGFINLLSGLNGVPRTKYELAREAIYAEQVLLKENVGIQDQLHASFGGINRFNFKGEDFSVVPIRISGADLRELTQWMILVYTQVKRRASKVVQEQVSNIGARTVDAQLGAMVRQVEEAQRILENGRGEGRIRDIAKILHEGWRLKKSLSSSVSLPAIDELYEQCLTNGALGGKLCGAGGGGFLLMMVPPSRRAAFKAKLGERNCVDIDVDCDGSVLLRNGR